MSMSETVTKKVKNIKDVLKKKDSEGPFSSLFKQFLIVIIVITAILLVYERFSKKEVTPIVSIGELSSLVSANKVKQIEVYGNELRVTKRDDTKLLANKEKEISASEALLSYGVSTTSLASTTILVKGETAGSMALAALPLLLPFLFIGLTIWWLARGVKGANMQALSFGQSRAKVILPDDTNKKVLFKDVAGVKEAKEELVEVVDFLRNPKKFLEIGAEIPKGVLLMGAPGTGKTMLARAVAGEAGVPFFHLSGSEFEEMFVGVGASRVRDLFDMAKKQAPAIIFIDEIDAIGRARSTSMGGQGEAREQTLNQILVEMDGFEKKENVIVMAATNRPDVLDAALLRPGRFDRRVTLDLPDRIDREEILKVHIKDKPLAEDINFVIIAERTPGFSGADLYSLMNEGAILAAREGRKKVAQFDLVRAIEKVMLGPERKSHVLSLKEKKITAYHEAGHALVASCLPDADPVHKISIIARGRAGGYTLKLPFDERRLMSKRAFLDDIAMSLGGYVAEKLVFGDLTTGPSNDLQVATAMARDMVTRYGMSDLLGPIALEGSGTALYGRGMYGKEYSEEMGAKIDGEVKRIMNEGWERAKVILTEKREALNSIAEELIKVENIEREEFEKLLVLNGIVPKKREEIA